MKAQKVIISLIISIMLVLCTLQAFGISNKKEKQIEKTENYLTIFENPIWKKGNYWKYDTDLRLDMVQGDETITVELDIYSLEFRVSDIDNQHYYVNINGDYSGVISFDFINFPEISGDINQGQFSGSLIRKIDSYNFEDSSLGIEGVIELGIIAINFEITISINFIPGFQPIPFPISKGDEWTFDNCDLNFNYKVNLQGINEIFSFIPSEWTNENTTSIGGKQVIARSISNITVDPGMYETIRIDFDNTKNRVYYAPFAGNPVQMVFEGEIEEDPTTTIYKIESKLIQTTYSVPGAPSKPQKPSGPTSGSPGYQYSYSSRTTDPEDDQIYYFFDFGDNTYSGWLGPFNSGELCETTHEWEDTGNYKLRVKAKDAHGNESLWSNPLEVSMPKNKILSIMQIILDKNPRIQRIINFLENY